MTDPASPPTLYPPLAWLEAEDNIFGLRLLDVRGLTQAWSASSQDPRTNAAFQRLRRSNGEQLPAETRDWPPGPECDLRYPLPPGFKSGAVFLAREMEDKWDIFHPADGCLYFCRSWTGTPIFRAAAHLGPEGLRLTRLDLNPAAAEQDRQLIPATVDFLVKSLLFGRQVPLQVARRVLFHSHAAENPAETEEQPNDPQEVAEYLFHEYGQRGCFATLEDTLPLPVTLAEAGQAYPLPHPEQLAEIRAKRFTGLRPPYAAGDDELAWNLFGYLESSGLLNVILSSMHGGPLEIQQVLYWGYDPLEKRIWTPFKTTARLFGETPPGAAPDLILSAEKALFFIAARLEGDFNSSPRRPAGQAYTTASAGWYRKVFQAGFEQAALERKKFELLRYWLIGTKIASQAGQAFTLLTLSPDGLARQVEGEFAGLLAQNEERAFISTSWEQMARFIQRTGPPLPGTRRILDYLADKTRPPSSEG